MFQAIGLLGSVIMPHNLYLHSALVLTRKINHTSYKKVQDANIYNSIETGLSLLSSYLINFAIVGTFAHYSGINSDINLYNADKVLAQTFGTSSKYIWAIGLLAAGQSSTMTGAYAGQYVAEGFLDIKIVLWKRVLLTRSLALFPALFITLLPEATIRDQDTYLNILQSIQLPFALIPLIKFVGNQKITNKFAISRLSHLLLSFTAFVLISINVFTIFTINFSLKGYILIILILIGYFIFIIIIMRADTKKLNGFKELYEEEQIEVEDEVEPCNKQERIKKENEMKKFNLGLQQE